MLSPTATLHSFTKFGDEVDSYDPMAWAKPEYTRNQVDKAGFIIADPNSAPQELEFAFRVINNWRSAHSYPLNTFQVALRNNAKSLEKKVLVAQRIKRIESIILKLRKNTTNTMQLSQMQDIGGCRAVMSSLENVYALVELFKKSKFQHPSRPSKDYILSPKEDGYRGVHLIYQYKGRDDKVVYDKLRIEIQIRTRMQHAWATAVEAVETFTKQALKSNQGDIGWHRFFALMASFIAHIEGSEQVPNTPTNRKELREEIESLSNELQILQNLMVYAATIHTISDLRETNNRYFLVRLNTSSNEVFIRGFPQSASQAANDQYLEIEREIRDSLSQQVVLVSVDSLKALKKAYPNYFLDTAKFIALLKKALTD